MTTVESDEEAKKEKANIITEPEDPMLTDDALGADAADSALEDATGSETDLREEENRNDQERTRIRILLRTSQNQLKQLRKIPGSQDTVTQKEAEIEDYKRKLIAL